MSLPNANLQGRCGGFLFVCFLGGGGVQFLAMCYLSALGILCSCTPGLL